MKVVTVTLNPCIDKTFSVERVAPDRKLHARDVRTYPGGGGLNVARVVHELGGDALALWTRGGTSGDRLAELLDDEGVPNEAVRTPEPVRENVIVGETSSRRQFRFGMPGPELGEEECGAWLRALRELPSSAGYVVLSGSLPPGLAESWYGELLQAVPDGVRVVVDTKREALARALKEGVYLVKPNVHELGEVVGRELDDDDEIERAARELVDGGGASVVLVSLGRGGAVLVGDGTIEHLHAPTVPVRSRIGAGDSMVGGLVHALARELPLEDAGVFGVAAGAAAVTTEGTALCRREDAERLYERMRRRRGPSD